MGLRESVVWDLKGEKTVQRTALGTSMNKKLVRVLTLGSLAKLCILPRLRQGAHVSATPFLALIKVPIYAATTAGLSFQLGVTHTIHQA